METARTIALLDEIVSRGGACSTSLLKVEAVYELWEPLRKATIASLNSVADELEKGNREVDKTTIATSAVSVLTGAAVAAGVHLPRRVSIPLATTGAVVGIASGATNLGKGVAFEDTKSQLLKATKEQYMEDKAATDRLRAYIEELTTNVDEIKKICFKIRERQAIRKETQRAIEADESSDEKLLEAEFEELSEGASAIVEFINHVITRGLTPPERARNLKTAIKAILKLPKTYMLLRRVSLLQAKALSSIVSSSCLLGGAATSSLNTCSEVTITAGSAFALISIFINSFELVNACEHWRKGSKSKEADELRAICRQLQQEKEDFDTIYSKLQEQQEQEKEDFDSRQRKPVPQLPQDRIVHMREGYKNIKQIMEYLSKETPLSNSIKKID